MFRYLLALFLINSYTNNYSLGGTVPDPSSATLTRLLNALGESCENPFLVKQIQAKLSVCSNLSPRPKEELIQCMLFYDINKQLCDAFAASKVALLDDYSKVIDAFLDVEDTCKVAPKWNFTDIPQIPTYRKDMLAIFKNRHGCIKVCDIPEVITSADTNSFCKYFMWGVNVLSKIPKIPADPVEQENKVETKMTPIQVKIPDALPGLVSIHDSAPSMIATGVNIATKVNETSKTADVNVIKAAGLPKLEQPKVNDLPSNDNKAVPPEKKDSDDIEVANVEVQVPNKETQEGNEDTQVGNEETQVANEDTKVANEEEKVGIEETRVANKDTQVGNKEIQVQKDYGTSAAEVKNKNSAVPLAPSVAAANALDKPSAAEVAPSNKEEQSAYEFNRGPQGAMKKMMIEPDPDYNDSDEVKEGLINGDDNVDDPSIGGEIESKPEILQPQTKNTKPIETSMTFIGEREFYPLQDQFVEDDDDHFFPFFLTGIILVVLLYILYHNKSKVTKVVLGLIVEGRQPGRRRNSRGHAYKRLDTLEQAMSTNSAAPPSKIIY